MTLSPETQRSERIRLLRGMLDALGDRACLELQFQAAKDFPEVHASAWREMEDEGLVTPSHVIGEARYKLTAEGWLVALVETGRTDDFSVLERCQRLMQLLKRLTDSADSPHHDQPFDWRYDVPPESALPPGWVLNALSSGLLAHRFPNHRINHYRDLRFANRNIFRIPTNFGRKLID